MSLINKMLQDLDARGGAREESLQQQELKPVPAGAGAAGPRPWRLAGSALLLGLLAGAGWFGWQSWQAGRPATGPAGPVPQMRQTGPAAAAPASAPASTPASAAASAMVPAGLNTVTAPKTDTAAAAADTAAQGSAGPAAPVTPMADAARIAGLSPSAGAKAAGAAGRHSARGSNGDESGHRAAATPGQRTAAAAAVAPTGKPGHAGAAVAAVSASPARAAAGKVELTSQQQAENTYRRALAALQEGRLSVALNELDHALELDPRNDGARQTYVSLLLEQGRTDDAIRQLRLALGIDPRQPQLAMVLARLQLERGGPALDTLMTTLPYAGSNAEYQALLAGVLQRAGRHAEAARYYQAAIRLSPQSGVWWMGLAISLQADGHAAEARDAYGRARSGNGITPELLAFIERRLAQLER